MSTWKPPYLKFEYIRYLLLLYAVYQEQRKRILPRWPPVGSLTDLWCTSIIYVLFSCKRFNKFRFDSLEPRYLIYRRRRVLGNLWPPPSDFCAFWIIKENYFQSPSLYSLLFSYPLFHFNGPEKWPQTVKWTAEKGSYIQEKLR